jgi:hypothetical protein
VSASALSGKTNTATSKVGVLADAAVIGSVVGGAISGAVTITGALNVTATGTAVALAEVQQPTISLSGIAIVANILNASLESIQKARIADVNAKASSITVTSNYNNGVTDSRNGGANAVLRGTGAGAALSFVGVDVNTANATAGATNKALISGANLLTGTGAVSIGASGTSLAKASVEKASGVGFATFGVTIVNANANGDYEAYLDATGATAHASSLTITNTYTAQANAETAQSNGGGVNVSAAAGKTNIANAKVGILANAALLGTSTKVNGLNVIKGVAAITGAVSIKAAGTGFAVASVQ